MGSYDGVARGRGCPDQTYGRHHANEWAKTTACRTPCAHVERYSSRGRCDGEDDVPVRLSRDVRHGCARGDELALILSCPLPRAK